MKAKHKKFHVVEYDNHIDRMLDAVDQFLTELAQDTNWANSTDRVISINHTFDGTYYNPIRSVIVWYWE